MAQPYAPPGDPTEVLGRRFAALAIDLFFLAIVGVILFITANHQNLVEAPANACSTPVMNSASLCLQNGDRVLAWESAAVVRSLVLIGVAGFLDLVALQTLTGASIGKLCVGLRVIEVQGNEARFLRVLGRWLFLVVDLGCFLVGLVTTLATHPHRRVGDLVCGTYVVGVTSVGQPVVVQSPYAPVYSASPPAYAAPVGAPTPPGWGSPAGLPPIPPPATVATPPGTSPTTPGEWGAVARSAPVVRAPKWDAPPPGDEPVPVARDTLAPQWATPPGPKRTEESESEQPAAAEPMPAPEAAPEPLTAAPAWSPIVPLTTKDNSNHDESAEEPIQPPPPPPSPWNPIVAASDGEPTPSDETPPTPPTEPLPPPVPPPPTEPSPPPPTEPEPEPPAAKAARKPKPPAAKTAPKPKPPAAKAAPEPEDDVPWWDAEPSRNDADR